MDNLGRTYFLGGHNDVIGWIGDSSLSLMLAIDRFQKRYNIHGAVCEIGVHHGRFFIPLALLRRPKEQGIAIDVFDLQEFNVDQSGYGDLVKFQENLRAWIKQDDITIYKKDSTSVSSSDILNRTDGNQVRLFSVDGSHTARHTVNDARLASRVLSPGGVIIIDDFLNPDWPGVLEGLATLLSNKEVPLACLCYGDNKIILVFEEDHEKYFNFLRNDLVPFATRVKQVEMWGFQSYHLLLNGPNHWFDLVGRRCLAETFVQNLHVNLGENWALAEPAGCWTLGTSASVQLGTRQDGHPCLLGIEAMTFFHGTRSQQSVSARLGCLELGRKPVTEICEWITFEIPAGIILNEPIVVHLDIEESRSPLTVGLGTDVRPLGIKVLRVAVFSDS